MTFLKVVSHRRNNIIPTSYSFEQAAMENAGAIRTRIFDAANALYEETGRLLFPTVDAVRKRARVNMNDASTCMKDWRRAQTAQVAPVSVQVPAPIQEASNAMLADLWSTAVTLANESLRAAQAGWDADRAESDTLAQQLANAFEEQAAELGAANSRVAELQASISATSMETATLRGELNDTLRELDIARTSAKQADAKSIEIERRVGDLRVELDHAHQLAALANDERTASQQRADREIDALRAEVRKVRDDAELECARAQAALTSATATAARLSGQIEALTASKYTATSKRKPPGKGLADGHANEKG
jgi:colicin import membrane protein